MNITDEPTVGMDEHLSELRMVGEGIEASRTIKELAPQFESQRKDIIETAMAAIRNREMTPDQAYHLWMRYSATAQVERDFLKTSKLGQQAAERVRVGAISKYDNGPKSSKKNKYWRNC